jgi:hypothetical protein
MQLSVKSKSYQDPYLDLDPHGSAWIRIGLAPWILIGICIEIKKSWIRILTRNETNAEAYPQHKPFLKVFS